VVPDIETIMVQNDELPPQGRGGHVIVLMGGLIANATADAAAVRVFEPPMTPGRVREAIENRAL
jgi:nicotinate dehydrogenase subunit B